MNLVIKLKFVLVIKIACCQRDQLFEIDNHDLFSNVGLRKYYRVGYSLSLSLSLKLYYTVFIYGYTLQARGYISISSGGITDSDKMIHWFCCIACTQTVFYTQK